MIYKITYNDGEIVECLDEQDVHSEITERYPEAIFQYYGGWDWAPSRTCSMIDGEKILVWKDKDDTLTNYDDELCVAEIDFFLNEC